MPSEPATREVTDKELEEWRNSIGRQKIQHANADVGLLRRFALACDIDPDVERAMPALAHWALFVEAATDERIGPDGHPKRGDFLPNVFLPRRMFAASEMEFQSPLKLNSATQMISTVTSVKHKSGRTGDLVFVKVQREVSQRNRVCVSEEQTIVYRQQGAPLAAVDIVELPHKGEGEVWTPGPTQLFRFSAVTYNAHRIHYDLPYATGEEGYPGLVVHGPFTAVKLLDYACRDGNRQANTFSFRGVAPLFVSQPIVLSSGEANDQFEATRCDGNIAMSAAISFS